MDDIGALIWRVAKRLIVSNAETEAKANYKPEHKPPPKVVHSPAAE
jgi:hypothetical protein